MVAIGLVLFLLGGLVHALAPTPPFFDVEHGTWKSRKYLLFTASIIAVMLGVTLMAAGLVAWLWQVMP